MTDLITRLEQATEGSRELDTGIGKIQGWCFHVNKTYGGWQDDTGFDCPDCGADSWGNTGPSGQKLNDLVPHYTTSLDAKLPWENIVSVTKTGGRFVVAHEEKDGGVFTGNAKTEPLARRIAALKAKENG